MRCWLSCVWVLVAVTAAHGQSPVPQGRTGAPAQGPAPRAGAPRRGPAQPPVFRAPEWVGKLTPAHIKWRDDILKYWEARSDQIANCSCAFQRFDYDPQNAPGWAPGRGPLPATQISSGTIKYAAPDKGYYRDDAVRTLQGIGGDGKPAYKALGADAGVHWVCNGQSVFEYEYGLKQLKETQLPASFRGKSISEFGPLPFIFNAKADQILLRYWCRVVTPKGKEGEYWLEFVPKNQADAADRQMVHVIIDQKDYLPKALIVFGKTYTPQMPERTTFIFNGRKVNEFRLLPERWRSDFFDVKTPQGWQRLVDRLPEPGRSGVATPPVAKRGPAAGAPATQRR